MSPRSKVSRETPVIGISTYVEPTTRGIWVDQYSAVLPHRYIAAVESVGAVALLIPPRHEVDDAFINTVLDRVDALIIAGGADVEPVHYGEDPHHTVQDPSRDRDATELALARVARERGMPLLGICRGMQVMAVAAGGKLEQHVPDRVGHDDHSPTPGEYGQHPVKMVEGTRIASIIGDHADVPTYHHQAVSEHPGFVTAAYADDGTIEAMECPDEPFTLAVQWHPEAGEDMRLFEALVAAIR